MSTISQDGDSQQMAQPNPFDKYELRQRLGQSDNVEVWKAFDPQRKEIVAIKIIHPNLQADHDFPIRFMEGVKRISSLQHPNIVHIRDFGFAHAPVVTDTRAYIVMDYIEGQKLDDYIQKTSRQGKYPSSSELVRLWIPISLAIDYAHHHRLLHGDLKPGNILLDASNTSVNTMGQPIICDFGFAHILRMSTQTSSSSSQADSIYTAPEQAQGDFDNERSDLYSLGVILYEIFTGMLPFQGNDPIDPIKKRFQSTAGSTGSLTPNMQPAVTAVLLRNLAKNPAQRYPSAVDLVIALAKALNIPVPGHLKQDVSKTESALPSSQSLSEGQGDRGATTLTGSSQQDEANEPTFLSPLPVSRPLGTTPSSPSWTGIVPSSWGAGVDASTSAASMPSSPSKGMTPQSGAQGPGNASFQTLPMTSSGQFPVPQAALPQGVPLQATTPPALTPGLTPVVSTSYPPQPMSQPRRRRGPFIALIAALIVLVVLAGSGLGAYFVFFRHYGSPFTTAQPIVGHAFFVSSGLLRLNQNSVQGITDELQLNLQGIQDPQAGKSYYAWLLNDQENINASPILLGKLQVNHGKVDLSYPGDAQHTNLLANYGRLLITEEDASITPTNPSLDPSAMRYYAAFPTMRDPATGFSVLDHLRHLLAKDPKLELVGLHGGLDIWLYKNTTKVLEAAGAARDSQKRCTAAPNNPDCAFLLREIVRILEYLDGVQYVRSDVPPALQLDPVVPRVALLEFNAVNQVPPGFLKHIGNHLREIANTPGVTQDQRTLAIQITQSIDNVQGRLDTVRADALKLVKMNNAQLSQPNALSTLNDLFTQANYAFVGQFDPNTNTVKEGVAQIHYNIQKLATFDLTSCTNVNGQNSCT